MLFINTSTALVGALVASTLLMVLSAFHVEDILGDVDFCGMHFGEADLVADLESKRYMR